MTPIENAKRVDRLVIDSQPAWSPHRMWLRIVGVGNVYWLQERKTGARRGMTPAWLGFDERDVAVMRRIAACWNACEGLSTEQLELTRKPAYLSIKEQIEKVSA